MAGKKKQSAQEVQENTNKRIDAAFGVAEAEYLINKAAEYYGRPAEETTLQDAFEMLEQDQTEEEIAEEKEIIIKAAEEITGKAAADITGADINSAINNVPLFSLSGEALDLITNAMGKSEGFRQLAATVAESVASITQSPEFKALAEIGKATAEMMANIATHSSELAETLQKAQDFTESTFPYIALEIAARTGHRDIKYLSLDDIEELINTDENFEKELNAALDNFSFDGTPETDFAREILEAANKRKSTLEENKEVIEAITSIAESVNNATDTEKAEIVKRELPALKQALPVYLKVAKGLPTDVLLYADKKTASIDDFTKVATLKTHDLSIFVENYESIISNLSINTDKLLNYAIYHFTKNNDFRNKKEINCSVIFDLRDYAYMLGYDVFPHNNTDKEKKRANKRLDKARENVNKNLDLLFSLSISWKDDSKRTKDRHDYNRIRLISERGQIKNNMVYFTFTPAYAAYLVNRNVIGQYPAKLLAMDSRKTTAYKIAKKLFDYYFIDNNIIHGTNDILSIKSILPFSGLASYEEVQKKDRGHWIERIKEPLEAALDELTQLQILSDWEYTHEKKRALSYDEAAAIIDYYEYEKLYLHFTPYEELDQQERIEAKQQRIAAATERKAKRKQAAINQNIKKKANKEINAQGKT